MPAKIPDGIYFVRDKKRRFLLIFTVFSLLANDLLLMKVNSVTYTFFIIRTQSIRTSGLDFAKN